MTEKRNRNMQTLRCKLRYYFGLVVTSMVVGICLEGYPAHATQKETFGLNVKLVAEASKQEPQKKEEEEEEEDDDDC